MPRIFSSKEKEKISLNERKTELIYFRKSGPAPLLKIKLHGKTLTPSNSVKYLGVYIDELMNMKTFWLDAKIRVAQIFAGFNKLTQPIFWPLKLVNQQRIIPPRRQCGIYFFLEKLWRQSFDSGLFPPVFFLSFFCTPRANNFMRCRFWIWLQSEILIVREVRMGY